MVESVYAYKVISNIDKGCLNFIDKFKNTSNETKINFEYPKGALEFHCS